MQSNLVQDIHRLYTFQDILKWAPYYLLQIILQLQLKAGQEFQFNTYQHSIKLACPGTVFGKPSLPGNMEL